MNNHADAIAAYSGVKIRADGRWTASGFAPPEGVIPLHLRIEVTIHTLFSLQNRGPI